MTPRANVLDGVELEAAGWGIRPLHVDLVEFSFFGDCGRFPSGTIVLDSAFLMANLPTTWRALPQLRSTRASEGVLPESRR